MFFENKKGFATFPVSEIRRHSTALTHGKGSYSKCSASYYYGWNWNQRKGPSSYWEGSKCLLRVTWLEALWFTRRVKSEDMIPWCFQSRCWCRLLYLLGLPPPPIKLWKSLLSLGIWPLPLPPSQISQHLSGSCSVLAMQWLPWDRLNSNNMESLVPDLRDFQHELDCSRSLEPHSQISCGLLWSPLRSHKNNTATEFTGDIAMNLFLPLYITTWIQGFHSFLCLHMHTSQLCNIATRYNDGFLGVVYRSSYDWMIRFLTFYSLKSYLFNLCVCVWFWLC